MLYKILFSLITPSLLLGMARHDFLALDNLKQFEAEDEDIRAELRSIGFRNLQYLTQGTQVTVFTNELYPFWLFKKISYDYSQRSLAFELSTKLIYAKYMEKIAIKYKLDLIDIPVHFIHHDGDAPWIITGKVDKSLTRNLNDISLEEARQLIIFIIEAHYIDCHAGNVWVTDKYISIIDIDCIICTTLGELLNGSHTCTRDCRLIAQLYTNVLSKLERSILRQLIATPVPQKTLGEYLITFFNNHKRFTQYDIDILAIIATADQYKEEVILILKKIIKNPELRAIHPEAQLTLKKLTSAY